MPFPVTMEAKCDNCEYATHVTALSVTAGKSQLGDVVGTHILRYPGHIMRVWQA